jgi:hypothetical protein
MTSKRSKSKIGKSNNLKVVCIKKTKGFKQDRQNELDIVHEYLGYNLLVQFLMIPFCFAVQTRYLMMTGHTLPWYCLLTITILNSKLFIHESSTKTLIKESQKSLKLKFILAILFKPFGFLVCTYFLFLTRFQNNLQTLKVKDWKVK